MEYDLLTLGLDIADIGTPRLSYARLRRLIERLPRESHTAREVHGAAVEWGTQEHLLAHLVDVTSTLVWMYASTHSKSRPQRPDPIRRPGSVSAGNRIGGRVSFTPEELEARHARMRPRAG